MDAKQLYADLEYIVAMGWNGESSAEVEARLDSALAQDDGLTIKDADGGMWLLTATRIPEEQS